MAASLRFVARESSAASRLGLIGTLSLAVTAIPGLATAQSQYSWELSGLESSTDSGVSNFDSASFGATYYFGRVQDGTGPYALAAFLDPATSVSVATDQTDLNDSWSLSGKHLFAESGWYLGGRYQNDVYPDDVYGLIAGKYLGPRTTLELTVDTVRRELALACFVQPCGPLTDSVRTETETLSFVHVRDFRSLTYVLSGGVTRREVPDQSVNAASAPVLDVEPLRTYSIEAALYPTQKLGVRLGYDTTHGNFESDGYSLGARWFFRRNVAFELSLSTVDLDLPAPYGNPDTRSLRIIGRF